MFELLGLLRKASLTIVSRLSAWFSVINDLRGLWADDLALPLTKDHVNLLHQDLIKYSENHYLQVCSALRQFSPDEAFHQGSLS